MAYILLKNVETYDPNIPYGYTSYDYLGDAIDAAQTRSLNEPVTINIINEQNGCIVYSTADPYELARYTEMSYDEWNEATYGTHAISKDATVYFDIDGTTGRWYSDMRGFTYEEILNPVNHYFRNIEPHPVMIALAEKLCEIGVDVAIISAADRNTIRDKWEWIDEHMPFIPKENICFAPIGADKSQFVKGNADKSILIDDYHVNLNGWRGEAIKAITPANSHQDVFAEIDFTAVEAIYDKYLAENVDNFTFAEFLQHCENSTSPELQNYAKEVLPNALNEAVQLIKEKIDVVTKNNPEVDYLYQLYNQYWTEEVLHALEQVESVDVTALLVSEDQMNSNEEGTNRILALANDGIVAMNIEDDDLRQEIIETLLNNNIEAHSTVNQDYIALTAMIKDAFIRDVNVWRLANETANYLDALLGEGTKDIDACVIERYRQLKANPLNVVEELYNNNVIGGSVINEIEQLVVNDKDARKRDLELYGAYVDNRLREMLSPEVYAGLQALNAENPDWQQHSENYKDYLEPNVDLFSDYFKNDDFCFYKIARELCDKIDGQQIDIMSNATRIANIAEDLRSYPRKVLDEHRDILGAVRTHYLQDYINAQVGDIMPMKEHETIYQVYFNGVKATGSLYDIAIDLTCKQLAEWGENAESIKTLISASKLGEAGTLWSKNENYRQEAIDKVLKKPEKHKGNEPEMG